MPESRYLQGACVWKGAEMRQSRRWIKEIPAALADEIAAAAAKAETLNWRQIGIDNFPLPSGTAFFDDVREELFSELSATGRRQYEALGVQHVALNLSMAADGSSLQTGSHPTQALEILAHDVIPALDAESSGVEPHVGE